MPSSLTWLGHSCLQLETSGQTVLIDPFLTGNPAAAVQAADVAPQFIVLTHGHGDHVGDVVTIAARTGCLVIADYEITVWLERQGITNVHAMNTGGGRDFPFGRLQLTIAHHTSMLPDGSNGGAPHGLLFTLRDGRKLYCSGDTALFLDMQLIG